MSSISSDLSQTQQFTRIFQGAGSIGSLFVSTTNHTRQFLCQLKRLQICAVISAQKDQQINFQSSLIHSYLYIPIQNTIQFNISQYFQQIYKFIEQNRIKTHILIHCSTGLHCSIAVICAYLIKKYQYKFQEAIDVLKRKYDKLKKCIKNNEFNLGFINRLEYLSVQNGDWNKVKDNHLRRKIQRIRYTYEGIARSYSKELTKEEKILGIKKNQNSVEKIRSNQIMKSMKSITLEKNKQISSQKYLISSSSQYRQKLNPQSIQNQSFASSSRFTSQQYIKYLPKQSLQEQQQQQHDKKIAQQIFLLSQQSKLYLSHRMEKLNEDSNQNKNYHKLIEGKRKLQTFYSPLKKYEKYQMFTTNKVEI